MTSQMPSPEEFEEFLRNLSKRAGGEAGSDFEKMLGNRIELPAELNQFRAIFETIQGAVSGANADTEKPVDWRTAAKTARAALAKKSAQEQPRISLSTLQNADLIARSWVSLSTEFVTYASQTEFAPRDSWPDFALPFFKLVANPIATRSGADAIANFRRLMPGQPDSFYQMIIEKMEGVAAHLHGAQIGSFIALVADGVLIGSELGVAAGQRPLLVSDNAAEFAATLAGSVEDTLIYLVAREVLAVALFDSNAWLRESLVTQVSRYASHLSFNSTGMEELQTAIQNSDFESMGELMGSLVNVTPSEEQVESLERLQHLATLVAGWVDSTLQIACRHLQNFEAIDEAYRRRRVVNSPQTRLFRLLLNFEIDPAKIRLAGDFWRAVQQTLSPSQRDALWHHPDLLPTPDEVVEPSLLLTRISTRPDDEVDQALRRLLEDSNRDTGDKPE